MRGYLAQSHFARGDKELDVTPQKCSVALARRVYSRLAVAVEDSGVINAWFRIVDPEYEDVDI